jgi:GTP diphosphokinase / guanosine-3',5'-bis(diphosphate) 3'-diphosphatase
MKAKLFLLLICSLGFMPHIAFSTQLCSELSWPKTYFMDTLFETLPDNPKIRSLTFHLLNEWQNYKTNENSNFDIEKLILAIIYGAEKHHEQTRKDAEATPYIIHPLQVCNNLWEIGKIRNSNILISAILHDTLEDTSATDEEIQKYFGRRVCETIKEITNDPTLSSYENKQRQIDHVPDMSQDARLVKLADRLANITDLRTPPPTWNQEKIDGYFIWGQKLLDALKGTSPSPHFSHFL